MISLVPVILRDLDRPKVEYLGRYKIIKQIGKGSHGTVFQCMTFNGFEYAIKQINNITMKNMMKNEIDALMSVCSTFVVRCYELFYDKNDHPCMVLELCDGGSLQDYMKRFKNNCFPEKICMEIFSKIVIGLQSIHDNNIIHRDIKLQNIMMKGNTPKISDFGIALHQSSQSRNPDYQKQIIEGTRGYLAPEILSGSKWNEKVDVWSLGILLFVMLFGEFPFSVSSNSSVESELKQIQRMCKYSNTLNYHRIKKLKYQNVSEDTVNILQSMLVYDQHQRISVTQLLQTNAILSHLDQADILEYVQNPRKQHLSVEKESKEEIVLPLIEVQKQLFMKLNSLSVDNSPVGSLKLYSISTFDQQNCSKVDEIQQAVPLVSEESIVPYNQMLKRIDFLIDTYLLFNSSLFANSNSSITTNKDDKIIQEEFNQSEISLILYFLATVIRYNLMGLNKILEERDNIFNISNWSQFIFSKTYLSMEQQVQNELQIWIEKTNVLHQLFQEIKLIQLSNNNNDDINDSNKSINNNTFLTIPIIDPQVMQQLKFKENMSSEYLQEKEKDRIKLPKIVFRVEKATIASENKRKSTLISQNSSSKTSQQAKNQVVLTSQKKELTLLPEIIEVLQSSFESNCHNQIPLNYSFKNNKLPKSLKCAFRAVLLTAYTRLNKHSYSIDSPILDNTQINKTKAASINDFNTMNKDEQLTNQKRNSVQFMNRNCNKSKTQVEYHRQTRILMYGTEFFYQKKLERQKVIEANILSKKRLAFRVLLACIIDNIILINDEILLLKEFESYLSAQKQQEQDQFLLNTVQQQQSFSQSKLLNEEQNDEFMNWTRQITLQQIENQTQDLFYTYLPNIEQVNISFF